MYKILLLLHVLGATVWAGGHLVLVSCVLPPALRRRDPQVLLDFESRFERIGIPALLLQVATGLAMAWTLLPQPAAWLRFEGHLGMTVGLKLALLTATVLLAAHARLRLIPRLSADRLPALALHVVAVTLLAVAFVIVGVGYRVGGYP